jgi:hypothetical protein
MESMLYSRTQSTVKKKVRKQDNILIAFHYQPGPGRRWSATRTQRPSRFAPAGASENWAKCNEQNNLQSDALLILDLAFETMFNSSKARL